MHSLDTEKSLYCRPRIYNLYETCCDISMQVPRINRVWWRKAKLSAPPCRSQWASQKISAWSNGNKLCKAFAIVSWYYQLCQHIRLSCLWPCLSNDMPFYSSFHLMLMYSYLCWWIFRNCMFACEYWMVVPKKSYVFYRMLSCK